MGDDDVRATEAYLQGLSGRPAPGGMDAPPAHAEGATLREALLDGPEVPTRGADWQDVLAREAANEPAVRPRFWAGLAASVMACMLAIWWFWPLDDNAMRGGGAGGGGSPAALWRSAQPAQDASRMATQLRIAGAQVEVAAQTNGDVLMSVQAAAEARAAVDAQLAALDTALNAQGQVQIRVTAAP